MAKKKAQGANVEFNMTPMIDVTFQLIIFFIIAGQIASNDLERLVVPKPEEAQAREVEQKVPRVVINIYSEVEDEDGPDVDLRLAARAKKWSVAGERIDVDTAGQDDLVAMFNTHLDRLSEDQRLECRLEVRCDYRIQYADVETVMLAAAEAGFQKMNITAIIDPKMMRGAGE